MSISSNTLRRSPLCLRRLSLLFLIAICTGHLCEGALAQPHSAAVQPSEAQPQNTRFTGKASGLRFNAGDEASSLKPKVLITFTQPVAPAQLSAHCAYHERLGENGRTGVKVGVKLLDLKARRDKLSTQTLKAGQEGRSFLVKPLSRLDWGGRWMLDCDAKLKRADQARSLDAFVSVSFKTLSGLTASVRLQDRQSHVKLGGHLYVYFKYNVSEHAVSRGCAYINQKTHARIGVSHRSSYYDKREVRSNFFLQSKTPLEPATPYRFECVGIKSHKLKLPLVSFEETSFTTYPPLIFSKLEYAPRAVPDRATSLSFIFTNKLKSPHKLSSTPPIPKFPEVCYSAYYNASLGCRVHLKPNQEYQIEVSPDQEDIYGQKLGVMKRFTIKTEDNLPAISLETGYYVAEVHRPVFPVWSHNTTEVDLKLMEVSPEQYYKLQPKLNWWSDEPLDFSKLNLPMTHIKYQTKGATNQWRQHLIDPAKLLKRPVRSGMYYVEVSSDEVLKKGDSPHHRKALVNFTDLGVTSKIAQAQGLVWVTRLSTGDSVSGAKVSVRNGLGEVVWRGQTDANGAVSLPARDELTHPEALIALDEAQLKLSGDAKAQSAQRKTHREWMERREQRRDALYIFARDADDWTMVNPDRSGSLSASNFGVSVDYDTESVKLRGHLHTDRGLYQPGETVHVKGLARESRFGGDLKPPSDKHAEVSVRDPRGVEIKTLKAEVSPFGGFWFDLDLPTDAKLGDYRLYARLDHGSFSRSFSVEKFKAATFEVSGKSSTDLIAQTGDLRASVSARYLYGAPLREGEVKVKVYSRPRSPSFRRFAEYSFRDDLQLGEYHSAYSDQRLLTSKSSPLNDEGVGVVSIPISDASHINTDADLIASMEVASPSNEVISKSVVVPFFKYKSYVGMMKGDHFIQSGQPHQIELISLSPRGERVKSSAEVLVTRDEWNCVWEDWGYRGSYKCKQEVVEVLKQGVELSADQSARVSFTPEQGGAYKIRVTGADKHVTSREVYAWGGVTSYPSEDSMTFDIVSSKDSYEVGEEAILVFKTDLTQAKGLVSIERQGVIETWPIEVTPTTQYVKVPIKESYAPNVYVSVALVQPRMGVGERAQPRMRMGLKALNVRSDQSRLKVSVTPSREEYQPGEEVTATIKVRDAQDRPVRAEVALTAADEGVLSLINFKTPDPIPAFYAPWGLGTDAASQYAYIKTIPSPNLERPATGGDSGGLGSIRSRFLASAVWRPGLVTNTLGEAKVSFKAPDNLTAFRMMAIAADQGDRFGSGDHRFKVKLPLQIHRSVPRFLSLGDRARIGVVLHNETGAAGEATVTLTLDDKLRPRDSSQAKKLTRRVQMKAGGRAPVLFEVDAVKLGESALTFKASLGEHRDAARFKIPVYHPSPLESHTIGSGTTAKSGGTPTTLSIKVPEGTLSESAMVSLSLDMNGLAGIERGLKELIRYPYGCLEQTTSKLIPMVATRQLADSLKLKELSGEELNHYIDEGIKRIKEHQVRSGGFSLWPGGDARPYYTAYALWGLYYARQAGYKIDDGTVKSALNFLRHRSTNQQINSAYQDQRHELGVQAFSLYVRALFNDADPQAAILLSERFSDMTVYGQSFLIQALAKSLGAQDQKVQASLNLLSAHIVDARSRDELLDASVVNSWYMSDAVRSTAAALMTLVEVSPESADIPYLVSRLMRTRRARGQQSTQANLYSLLALTEYARSLKSTQAKVRVTLGDETILEQTLRGDQQLVTITRPLKGAGELKITADQRVYYQADMELRRQLKSLKASDATHFTVQRAYLNEEGKPQRDFKVGDVVKVRLKLDLAQSANHLMLSDHIPGGFEVLNTKFKTVNDLEDDDDQASSFFREIHAERVDFASERLWKREHIVEYKMRAIAEGRFALPPSRAELMYEPGEVAQTSHTYINVSPK